MFIFLLFFTQAGQGINAITVPGTSREQRSVSWRYLNLSILKVTERKLHNLAYNLILKCHVEHKIKVKCYQNKAITLQIKLIYNKKVLLRERKRHTDRHVASPGGGVDKQMDGRTDTCENITFPHPSDAVGKNLILLTYLCLIDAQANYLL